MGDGFRVATPSRHGHSVQFSPFHSRTIACATGQYYGIAGCGTLFVVTVDAHGPPNVRQWNWNDCLFDVSWSEDNENILVTGGGDGSIQVFDICNSKGPISVLRAHDKEVYSVNWCQQRSSAHLIASASWDEHVKIWDMAAGSMLVAAVKAHDSLIYSAVWSPLVRGLLASTAGGGSVKLWAADDLNRPLQTIGGADTGDVLTCDWCKYDEHVLATGSVDGVVRVWDTRSASRPIAELTGHRYAVRRLKFSPFDRATLASCSYDFSVRLWNYSAHSHAVEVREHHTEFVCGIDFSLHNRGEVVDCSWDESVCFWASRS